MSNIYCPDCGKRHEYNFAKPNFCSGCGSPFGLAKLKQNNKISLDSDDDDDDEFEDDGESFTNARHVPNIQRIQVDIETEEQYNTFDLGTIVNGQPSSTSRASSPKRRARSQSIEDFKQNKK